MTNINDWLIRLADLERAKTYVATQGYSRDLIFHNEGFIAEDAMGSLQREIDQISKHVAQLIRFEETT